MHIHNHHRGKLDPHVIKHVFLGYSPTCYYPTSRKFYISANVTFNENKPYFSKSYHQGEAYSEDEFFESFSHLDLPMPSSSPILSANTPLQIESVISQTENCPPADAQESDPKRLPSQHVSFSKNNHVT